MSREFKVWLDSGANIHSKYEVEVTLEELGIEDEDWDEMSDEDKDAAMREMAFQHSDWGYKEI